MKETKKWIRLAFIAFIPLACIVAVNVIGDTANLFHNNLNNEVALSILEGKTVYAVGK